MLESTCMHLYELALTNAQNLLIVVYVYIYNLLIEQISQPRRSPRFLHRLILVFITIPISILIAISIGRLRNPIILSAL
jgi:hypothetical protein